MPRRLTFYILAALLIVLGGIVYYMMQLVETPELLAAAKKARAAKQGTAPPATPSSIPAGTHSNTPSKVFIDPELQRKADELLAPEYDTQHDLEVIREFLSLYSKAFGGGNPVGLNEDITAAITGTADPSRPGRVFPPKSPAIKNGQLIDRWGSPFWFHPESATKIEIRSAGPDKELFTNDDIILDR